jgi:uncharacterized protein (DUF934 family)
MKLLKNGQFSELGLEHGSAQASSSAAAHAPTHTALTTDTTPAQLAQLLDRATLGNAHPEGISIAFPAFTDGRGYSLARLVRERYGYQGELRATGDVGIDQLAYLARCGFDAFELPDNINEAAALAAFTRIRQTYQASVGAPQPHYAESTAVLQGA